MIKNPPAMQETRVLSLGWEDPLEKIGTPDLGAGEFFAGGGRAVSVHCGIFSSTLGLNSLNASTLLPTPNN